MLRRWTNSLAQTLKINKQDVYNFTSLVGRVRGGLYFLMEYKMFSEEKLSQARKKTIKHWYEIFLSIKMFIKIKTREGKTSAYRILLSFKTSITYNIFS